MDDLRVLLEDTVNRLFEEQVTREVIETAEQGEWPAALWALVEENGLTRPHLPESADGAGGDWLSAYAVLRAAGRFSAPLPLAETLLAGWLLHQAGLQIPPGPLTFIPSPLPVDTLQNEALTYTATDVSWGRNAEHVVFLAKAGTVGLVARPEQIEPHENIAHEPRDTLHFSNTPIIAQAATDLPESLITDYGAMLRSAQMAGALDALTAMSVQYAGERIQFGKPIGKFQAIQQSLAQLATQTASVGLASEVAFRAALQKNDPHFEIAVAKVRAGEASELATSVAHQTHGAIGFTYEHNLHFATRRLWAWRAEFGTDSDWAEKLGREALAQGGEALWPHVTTR